MFRTSLVLAVGLWTAAPVLAASWADAMFEELSRDFGSVPRGPGVNHAFRLTNKSSQPVHIASVRVSCGCVTATAVQTDLAPGETTTIRAEMDTRRFTGVKTVTIYVQFDRPQWEEVRLWVQANSRDDITLAPESLAFGQVRRGGEAAAKIQVTFTGNIGWQITEGKCDSNYVQSAFRELRRDSQEVTYEVSAKLRCDTPVGKWYTDVWLATNSAAMPRVRVPVTVEVESALSASPTLANLGQLKPGTEAERKVIIRGVQPFTITAIQGTDGQFSARESSAGSKPVHVLTVKLKAAKEGEVKRTLRILTDLKEDNEIEVQAVAQVVP